LDERWLPTGVNALGLGNLIANDVKSLPSPTLSAAMRPHLQLKDIDKAKTIYQTAMRNVSAVANIFGLLDR
ncbi:hypothetical protein OBB02_04565, partial [Candidatus Puniceispirillum sp.]|nr:hypothetical protein [Candidatus Puniceispirillum sp.]